MEKMKKMIDEYHTRLNKRSSYHTMIRRQKEGKRITYKGIYNSMVKNTPVNDDVNFWIESLKKNNIEQLVYELYNMCLSKKCEDCYLKKIFDEACKEMDSDRETYCSFVGYYVLSMEMKNDPEIYYDIEEISKKKLIYLRNKLIEFLEDTQKKPYRKITKFKVVKNG